MVSNNEVDEWSTENRSLVQDNFASPISTAEASSQHSHTHSNMYKKYICIEEHIYNNLLYKCRNDITYVRVTLAESVLTLTVGVLYRRHPSPPSHHFARQCPKPPFAFNTNSGKDSRPWADRIDRQTDVHQTKTEHEAVKWPLKAERSPFAMVRSHFTG